MENCEKENVDVLEEMDRTGNVQEAMESRELLEGF
jgi:hypothetical protein